MFSRPFFTYSLAPMNAFPSQTYVPLSNYIPYADGTRMDCAEYVQAPISTNYTANTTSFACKDAATHDNISLSEFISWNPSLNRTSPCLMSNAILYCAQLYNVVAPNITNACTQYETVPPGYDYLSFPTLFGVDPTQFNLWNPSISADCTNFQRGKIIHLPNV
jgi:hypothetical protein